MDKRQEKAKELYRNKKNGFICLRSCKQINPLFIYSPPSNNFLIQDCPVGFLIHDCSVGAAETAAPS